MFNFIEDCTIRVNLRRFYPMVEGILNKIKQFPDQLMPLLSTAKLLNVEPSEPGPGLVGTDPRTVAIRRETSRRVEPRGIDSDPCFPVPR
jgi:hypothetical protein